MILESVENGPLIWPSIEENRVSRPKKYSELSATEAIQADCDIKATNIILQGLPPEVYALVNNHKVVKELWERIQLLVQGTSLTKQERECKLSDEFDKFVYKKGETLHEFYLRFSLLLNDMNIYNMKLEQFQVNTKFLNTLPPEWSKFVTDVKLVRDLHTTNIDLLHAYLGQHEFHANEGRQTSLAAGTTRTYTSGASGSNSGKQRTIICYNCKREGHMSKQCTKPKRKRDDSWFKDKVLLVQAQASGQILHEEELAFLADPGILEVALMANLSHYGSDALTESNVGHHSETEITSDNNIIPYSQYVIESQQAAVQNSNSSTQQDALILSVIEQLKTQVVNCTKINLDNKSVNDTLTAELERYKEQVKVLKEGQNVDLKSKDNVSDSCAQSVEIDHLKQTLSEHLKEKESLMQMVTLLKNDFKKEESRNIDREIALEKRIKQLDNIVFKRDQSAQTVHMLMKPQFFYDHTLTSIRFSKSFLSKENLANFVNSLEPTLSSRPTNVEVPKELPKVNMVNTSLNKLKHHLAGFDVVVKERTMATVITEGSWGFEHTKACFRDEIIPFVKDLKDLFNTFDQYLIDELFEIQNVFHQMEQAVKQHRLKSKTCEVKMNQVLNENKRLLKHVINKDIVNIIMNSSVDNTSVNVHECEKCQKLKTELLNKSDFVEKEIYDKLFKSFTTLEKHCISLEVNNC
ncbi:retrovirus-related pol polyprotein from transposon TNT 1-94 [Tanacetum coccineum]|uniref:Retrovirus-related pol polyprotein from transposon TNT 1-94 n=1 Tax=Tanacetum coccineum TaxID=301880 RepID=A0ABQ4Y4M0_9ASTR